MMESTSRHPNVTDLNIARLDRAENSLRKLLADVDELRAKLVAAIAAEEGSARLRAVRTE